MQFEVPGVYLRSTSAQRTLALQSEVNGGIKKNARSMFRLKGPVRGTVRDIEGTKGVPLDRKRWPKKSEETYDEKKNRSDCKSGVDGLRGNLYPGPSLIQPARKRVRFSGRSCFFHEACMHARCDRLERVPVNDEKTALRRRALLPFWILCTDIDVSG